MGRIFKYFLRSFAYLTIFSSIAAVGLCMYVIVQVKWGDSSKLEKTTILSKIREGTTIYYLDETTQIGRLFQDQHRRYTPIQEIPHHMIEAVISVEDKHFYHHVGVDLVALAKAIGEGILRGGRFRRGGSTITQQTVKNIVNDWDTTFARKFREMIKALQLETLYSKHQILEFYLNQFHVAGNGSGIGIAARYYFDKDVKDLTLVESAFIAGSLKGPSKYNPYIKRNEKYKRRAKAFAKERKDYVLKQMFEQNKIYKAEYEEALAQEVPFNKGSFKNSEVALIELIKKQLSKKEILRQIGLSSPSDLDVAGYKIYTTLDEPLQQATQLTMKRHLSRIDSILSDFKPEPQDRFKELKTLEKDMFAYGKIDRIEGDNYRNFRIHLNFGEPQGIITNESLKDFASLLNLSDQKGVEHHLEKLIGSLKTGDILLTEVIEHNPQLNFATLELRKYPEVSGGTMVLDKGEVRAIVAGFDTIGYNRAFAKRQPGSVFKSLTFFAGMQLGWSVLDNLDNIRKVFPYQRNLYFPRPDHPNIYKNTSLLWTGILSENLASISLIYGLLDKTNFDQFKQILAQLDLMPKPGEGKSEYHYRLSEKTGIYLTEGGIKEHQLRKTITEIMPDFIFSGDKELTLKLRQLWWGRYYKGAIKSLRTPETEEEKKKNKNKKRISLKETYRRIALLENNFLHLKETYQNFIKDWRKIYEASHAINVDQALTDPELQKIIDNFRVRNNAEGTLEVDYYSKLPEPELKIETEGVPDTEIATMENSLLQEKLEPLELKPRPGYKLSVAHVKNLWKVSFNSDEEFKDYIGKFKLLGYLPIDLFKRIDASVQEKYSHTKEKNDPYLLDKFYEHHDFRVSIGLLYTAELARQCGIYNKVQPVLSLPLGTSDLTVGEIAKLYQTLIDGKIYRFYKDGPRNQLNFIRRVEDRFGNVIFEPKRQEFRLVSEEVTQQMRELLRKTNSHGTGRRARKELSLNLGPQNNIAIPSFGKTGTTNNWTTSYFSGSLPYPVEENKYLNLDNFYTIATYIGYDNNKSMRHGRQKIYGSSGALPAWIDVAKNIISIRKYKDYIDPLDLTILSRKEWPLEIPKDTNTFLVDLPRGLILRAGNEADKEIYKSNRLGRIKDYYTDIFIPDPKLNSLLYLPRNNEITESESRALSLFSKDPKTF